MAAISTTSDPDRSHRPMQGRAPDREAERSRSGGSPEGPECRGRGATVGRVRGEPTHGQRPPSGCGIPGPYEADGGAGPPLPALGLESPGGSRCPSGSSGAPGRWCARSGPVPRNGRGWRSKSPHRASVRFPDASRTPCRYLPCRCEPGPEPASYAG